MFTNKFFEILVKQYDPKQTVKALKKLTEEEGSLEEDEEPQWVQGKVYVAFSDIKGWQEDTLEYMTVEDKAKQPSDATLVYTYESGTYECI